jgi:crossover junction endodeoxyribonuclease RuvC
MTGLDRLNWIRGRIAESCARAHLAVMEGPSYASEGKYSHERAGLWWLVLDTLVTDYKVPVAVVPPAVLKRYATGKGNASKDAVLAAVIRRYPDVPVTGNDQADAWTLCAMGLRHLGHPAEESLPKPNLAAMEKVDWPEVVR